MLRIRNLSNQFQKRTLRVLHGQTQATPYAGSLHAALRNTDGSFRAPLATDSTPIDYSFNTFTFQGGLLPGTVMIKAAGESFLPAGGLAVAAPNSHRPFGLLANFVGGTIDDLQDSNEIGVWYGPGSVYEVLFPAFNDFGLATAYAAATPGNPVILYAGVDGRLCVPGASGAANGAQDNSTNQLPVAELVERRSAAVIQVKLLV